MEAVLKGLKHVSVHHIKCSLTCLEQIVHCFANQLGPEFNVFLYTNIVMESFSMLFNPDFDISEGSCFNIISTVVQVLAVLVDKCGADFLNYMANTFLPTQLGLNPNEVQQFCLSLQDINNKKTNGLDRFKQLFIGLLQSRKKPNKR